MQVTIQKKWASNRPFLIFYINSRSAAERDKSFLVQQFFKNAAKVEGEYG
jgi:hypothetical protein